MSKQMRGFAAIDPVRRREISSMGGKAAHEQGVAHEWSKAQARIAGRKGGLARARRELTKLEKQEA